MRIDSLEEYFALPDDGRHYEVWNGVLRELVHDTTAMSPAPNILHQLIAADLAFHLKAWAREHGGVVMSAPLDIVFEQPGGGKATYQPDVVWLEGPRERIAELARLEEAPALAVEILSPSTAKRDATEKRRLYEANGVRAYWLVDTRLEEIRAFALREDGTYGAPEMLSAENGDVLTCAALPGFSLPLAELFG
jgi:Uma2 family endonuclease